MGKNCWESSGFLAKQPHFPYVHRIGEAVLAREAASCQRIAIFDEYYDG
jgi:hypothetical protein